MANTSQTGREWKLFWDSAADQDSPTWVAQTSVADVSVNITKGEADVSRRASGWELRKGALNDASLEFTYVWSTKATRTFFDAMVDSLVNGTPIHMKAAEAALTTGVFAFTGWFEVFAFPIDQPLKDGVKVAVVMKPVDYEDSAGALVETSLADES